MELSFFVFFSLILLAFCQETPPPEYDDLTVLQQVAYHGKFDVLQKLLAKAKGIDDYDYLFDELKMDYRNKKEGLSAFQAAIMNGHKDIAIELLKYGADPFLCDLEGICPLHILAKNNQLEIIQLITTHQHFHKKYLDAKDKRNLTPLHFAAFSGAKDAVGFLLDQGANITAQDAKGFTPLFHATYETEGSFVKKSDMVKYLISRGAPPCESDARNRPIVDYHLLNVIHPTDFRGKKMEYEDSQRFSEANLREIFLITKTLLEAGCDPNMNATLDRLNPLWRVLFSGKKELFDLLFVLIRYGANINYKIELKDEMHAIWDAVAAEGGEDLSEQPYIRFIFLPLPEWGPSDIRYWLTLLIEENENDPEVKREFEKIKRKEKESLKGKFFASLDKSQFKSKLGLTNSRAAASLSAQLEELKSDRRTQKVFRYFWKEVWQNKCKAQNKKLHGLDIF